MRSSTLRTGAWGAAVLLACWWPQLAEAQAILLDRPVKAGELTVFPGIDEPLAYYYVSDKPRLAVDVNGTPQFSFLRYVENVRSGAGEPEAREGEGGGIVHALVSLGVTPDQLREAQRALQRLRPGAKIVGPVVYRSGKFGLVSSVADPKGNLSKQVLGLGSAPLLDGEKAAVSIQLTKLGAKILWESFDTPTPDVSFTFEMELAGYRSPVRALIEANFDQIYEHEAFAIGLASTYLSGEIKGAFDDLRRDGAIKLTQVGENAALEALITTAYNRIAEMMFAPVGGTGTPSLDSLGSLGGQGGGALDRATKILGEERQRTDLRNAEIRKSNAEIRQARAAEFRERGKAYEECAKGAGAEGGADAAAEARQCDELAGWSKGRAEQEEKAAAKPVTDEELQKELAEPVFAVVGMYEMKKVRQRGTFRIDLNKFTADTMTTRFDENIGDLRRLKEDAQHFRQVNLDDPLFRQREISVFVDGLNAADFGQYVNFVTVQMRKKHAAGEETTDEVRVDRRNFNAEGNAFKVLYGWKGDNDRRRWLDYEFQATWSFFGGQQIETPWQKARSGAINLAPPYQRRLLSVEADPDALAEAEVRAVTVKLFYDLGGVERVKQVTLKTGSDQLSQQIEFMLPADRYDFTYEVTWDLKGGRLVTSGRRSSSQPILFVNDLPST